MPAGNAMIASSTWNVGLTVTRAACKLAIACRVGEAKPVAQPARVADNAPAAIARVAGEATRIVVRFMRAVLLLTACPFGCWCA